MYITHLIVAKCSPREFEPFEIEYVERMVLVPLLSRENVKFARRWARLSAQAY